MAIRGNKMKKIIISILICLLLLIQSRMVVTNRAVYAEEINTTCKSALLYDAKSGTVIYEKDGHKRLPIASMTKLASLMIVFDAIDSGVMNEDTKVKISKHAAETEGSSAFLDENSEYKVSDLIMTVIVCSANDSTVALAEKIAGSEDEFVRNLNKKVAEMGLTDTNFINSTGLPAIDHYSSAYDISKIYSTICDNKIYRKYSKIWMTELVHPSGRKTDIVNTNKLIKTYDGCDSGKTGYTNDAGYCLSASATRSGMRLIGVVIGANDSKTRFNEMTRLFNYGFNNYENKTVINKDNSLCVVNVKNSTVKKVEVYPKEDLVKFLKKGEKYDYSLETQLREVKAPIEAGDVVGKLYVLNDKNVVEYEIDLVVRQNIKEIKIADIMKKIFLDII